MFYKTHQPPNIYMILTGDYPTNEFYVVSSFHKNNITPSPKTPNPTLAMLPRWLKAAVLCVGVAVTEPEVAELAPDPVLVPPPLEEFDAWTHRVFISVPPALEVVSMVTRGHILCFASVNDAELFVESNASCSVKIVAPEVFTGRSHPV